MKKIFLLAVLFLPILLVAQTKKIEMEDIWVNNTFKIKTVAGFNAMKDGKHYTQIDKNEKRQTINIYNLESGKKDKTIFNDSVNTYNGMVLSIDKYDFSDDEKKMLLFTESQNIYRRSILYKVYVFDIKSGTLQLIDTAKVLHAQFSPDGNKVAFVKNNNLFYKDLNSSQTVAITNEGEWNKIINGNCDWVYEEEFEFTQAYQWSPDGMHIAFYRFDESNVPQYTIPFYYGLHPLQYTYKYPEAGQSNSVIEIKIFDFKSGKTINAELGTETDQYIPRIKWSSDANKICIFRMNRLQNKLELLLADAGSGSSDVIYVEDNKYYIEISNNLEFLPDNASFIFNSEQSGYNHLYKWNWKESKLTRLTEGDYDVDEIVGVDKKQKLVYYTAAETSSLQRKLYAVDWNGEHKETLTPEDGTHAITSCTAYNYFLDKYSSLNNVPVYYLRDNKGKIVRTLEDNKELKNKMSEYALGKLQFTKLTGDSGVQLNAWMITPPDFNQGKKYPVLMFQYGGPGSQQVADKFPVSDYFWYQLLAEKGYIIVCADGTGTGFRGEAFRKKTYLQLGKYESNDQIAVAKYLRTQPYVDKNRIGIWGWSYGAFMSTTCIFKGNDVFKMAVAVAPVTNWRYYDNIYTERYMRTPQENPQGYDENAPEKMAAKLKGKLLLIHGTGDDNVHFQNSIMLVNELINYNKEFEGDYYPNRAHGISGGNARYHVYERITKFVLENL